MLAIIPSSISALEVSQQVRESAHALLDSGGNKSDEDKEAMAANTPIVIVHQDSTSPDEGIVLGPFCTKSQCGKNHSQIVSFLRPKKFVKSQLSTVK